MPSRHGQERRVQRPAVRRLRDRGVVLVHVRRAHLARVEVGGLQEALGQATPPQREHQGAQDRPAAHAEDDRLADAQAGRADQDEAAHARGVFERHRGGDCAAHRVPHEDRVGDMQRVEQGHRQASVGGVVVAGRGFVREAEPSVVERDHAKPRRQDGSEILAPGVHRGAEAVQEQHGRPAARIDVADPRALDRHGARGELGPSGEAARGGNRGRAAPGEQQDPAERPSHGAGPAPSPPSARRTAAVSAGWELQIPVAASPVPVASTTWAASIRSSVGVSAGALAAPSAWASAGTSPATRSASVVRSRARRHAGKVGRTSSAASTPSTLRSARATSCRITLASARAPGAVARGTARDAHGGGAADQAFQRVVGVGTGDPGRMGDAVAGRGAEAEQRAVDQGFGRGKAEGREVGGGGHGVVALTTTLEPSDTQERAGYPTVTGMPSSRAISASQYAANGTSLMCPWASERSGSPNSSNTGGKSRLPARMKKARRGAGVEKYCPRRSMNPARSRCTGGRKASSSTAKIVGGMANGSSTVLPWAFLNGLAASSLRRYCEMLLATVWAVPRTRGSSSWPPRASVHAAPSRPMRRAQRASPGSVRAGFWNSTSRAWARWAIVGSGSSGSMRDSSWKRNRSASRNGRDPGGQPNSTRRRY